MRLLFLFDPVFEKIPDRFQKIPKIIEKIPKLIENLCFEFCMQWAISPPSTMDEDKSSISSATGQSEGDKAAGKFRRKCPHMKYETNSKDTTQNNKRNDRVYDHHNRGRNRLLTQ